MSFEDTLREAIKDVVPSIVQNAMKPLREEIKQLKSQLSNQNNPFGNKEKFTISEIAEITGRSRSTVHKDINDNKLVAYQPQGSNTKYIVLEDGLQYIQANT